MAHDPKRNGYGPGPELRERARRRLGDSPTDISQWATADLQSLVTELELHQEELRIQNEELQAAQTEASEARDHYRDLFERAPVAYLRLDAKGRIQEANLPAEALLGAERAELEGADLAALLAADSQEAWFRFRRSFAPDMERRAEELTLAGPADERRAVRIETVAEPDTDPADPRFRCALVDITARREAEERTEELRESEANYPQLVDQHPELLVHRYLPDTTELFVNPAFATYFGAEPDDFLGWRWVDFVPSEDRQAVWDHLATYTPEAPSGQYENSALDAQGRRRWIRWSNQAFFDDDGRLQYFQAVGLDITERREAERSRDQLVQILEAAPDGIDMADTDGRILYRNPASEAMRGELSQAEELPAELNQAHPDWALRRLREEAFPTARRQGTWQGETAIYDNEGQTVPVSQVVIAHRDKAGTVQRFSTIIRDLSDIKEAEAFNRLLLNSLAEGVFGLDTAGRFTFLNPQALDLFGFTSERSVLGQSSHALTHHTDAEGDPYPATECPIYRVMTTGEPLEAWQDRLWRTDGTSFPVEVYAAPLREDGRTLSGAVVVFTDISERKAREDALRKYRTAFEQSRDAVMFSDPEHYILDANPAALALFRVPSLEAARDSHPSDFSPAYQPDGRPSREAASARIAEAFANGHAFFEWRHQTADGEPFPAEVQVSRVDRPEGPILEILVRDITDRKEAEANLQRRAEKDATMQAISTNLLAAPYDRINATIEDALARIGQAAEADRSYLFQLADDGRTMSNTHEWTAEGVTAQIQRLQGLPTADFAWLLDQFRRDEVFAIRSLAEIRDPGLRDLLARQGIRSLLIVPMLQGEQLIGYLGLDAVRSEREWSESEQHLLRIAAGPLAGALARQRLETKLQHQARHDPLTGLLNRRAFEEALAREAHRTQRYGRTFALIMLDIDHFKAINDTYGHELGDRILEELSTLVSERIRGADLLARWGGEEFIALLPDTGRAGARELAEAIRWQVAEQDFPGVGHMTISLGVVEYRAYEALKDVTKRVDEALYAAKEGGRNRVVVDGEDPGA